MLLRYEIFVVDTASDFPSTAEQYPDIIGGKSCDQSTTEQICLKLCIVHSGDFGGLHTHL